MAKENQMELHGKQYEFDEEGYLVNTGQWDTEIRDWLAKKKGIEQSDEHCAVLGYMRRYYEEHEIQPELRMITIMMSERFGREKGSDQYFHFLFPGGTQHADKLAWLPRRHSCC